MILGLISDTHGQAESAAQAVRVLRDAGAEALVHCGDVGGEAVFDQLAGLRTWFVWGNSDQPGPLLTNYVKSLGLPLPQEVPLRLELAGKSLAVFHGHEPEFRRLVELAEAGEYERLAESAAADYVLFGHSHVPFDERFGPVRVVSPGAVQRARQRSVATLDLALDELRFWEVDGQRRSLRGLSGLRWAAGD